MLRYTQSALAAAGLHSRKAAPVQQVQVDGVKRRQGSKGGGVIGTLSKTASVGQLAVQEVAWGVLKILQIFWMETKHVLGLVFWICALYANIWTAALAILALPWIGLPWIGLGLLAIQLALILLPLGDTPPAWAARILHYSISSAVKFFPMRLHADDPEALEVKRPYVVAFEPHSALPLAMPGVFCEYSGLLPSGLKGIKVLASSSVFFVPGLRHAWHWLGMRPVSRKVMGSILASGGSVALCPGGVQECLHMRHGQEVVYLRRRTGFVRMAMQNGAAIIPAFAFGQTYMYSWVKPGPPWVPAKVVAALARGIGFLPLLIYGVKGTPMPNRIPITVAVGAPLEVPHIADPTSEQLAEQLQRFIEAMRDLVHRHREAAGYPDLPLQVF